MAFGCTARMEHVYYGDFWEYTSISTEMGIFYLEVIDGTG